MEDMPDIIRRCLNNSSRSPFYVKGKLLGEMPFVSSVRTSGVRRSLGKDIGNGTRVVTIRNWIFWRKSPLLQTEKGWRKTCKSWSFLGNIKLSKIKCQIGNDIGRCDRLSFGAGLFATYAMYAEQGSSLTMLQPETENC